MTIGFMRNEDGTDDRPMRVGDVVVPWVLVPNNKMSLYEVIGFTMNRGKATHILRQQFGVEWISVTEGCQTNWCRVRGAWTFSQYMERCK